MTLYHAPQLDKKSAEMQPGTADIADLTEIPPAQVPKSRRFRTFRVIMALILREIGSRDSRSSLGFLWAILDPIGTVVVLSFAFSMISKNPRLGDNFQLYYVTGVVPFHMFTRTSNRVASSIRYSKQLLGFPAVTVLDALFARFLLNFLVDIVVFVVLATGVVSYYHLRVSPDVPSIISSLVMSGSLAVGVGTFNSVLFMAYPTYENIWGMFSRPMLLASGVMILINDLPDYLFRILQWNPMAHFVGEMRHAFFPSYDSSYVTPSYVYMIAGVTFTIGLVTLHRFVFDVLDR